MTFEQIAAFLAEHDIKIIEDTNYDLSEKFQGTIGRMFWFEASCVNPEMFEEDIMLVSVERKKDGECIHVEPVNGVIQEAWGNGPAEFERVSAHMTFEHWMKLMTQQMRDSYDESI